MHKTMCDVKIGEYTLPEVILFKPCIKPISLLSFFKLLFLIQVPDIVFKILKKPSNSVKTSFCTKRLICLPG